MPDANLNNAIRLLSLLGMDVERGAGCFRVSKGGFTVGLFGREALIDYARGRR